MSLPRAVGRVAAIIEAHVERLDGHALTEVDRDQLITAPASRIPMMLAKHGLPGDPMLDRRMQQAMGAMPGTAWPSALSAQLQGDAMLAYHAERTAIGRARKLNALKAKANLSRDDLAARIGERSDTVRDWLTGRRDMSADAMRNAEARLEGRQDD